MQTWPDFVTKTLLRYDISAFWAVIRSCDNGFTVVDCASDYTVCHYFAQQKEIDTAGQHFVVHSAVLRELYEAGRIKVE